MKFTLRALSRDELSWANERYAEIDFVPSTTTDYIAVAEFGSQIVGLGRVAFGDGQFAELGGVYVFPQFRGVGASMSIINNLVERFDAKTLYCLPFAKLQPLYEQAGFSTCKTDITVPQKILDKHVWCNSHYAQAVLLMRRDINITNE
jgi:predicted GNAT family N-acyltransferase